MKLRLFVMFAIGLFTLVMGWSTAAAQTTTATTGTGTGGSVGILQNGCITSPGGATEACFFGYGEIIRNCDWAADGHHPVVHYYRSTSPSVLRTISDDLGNGNCRDHDIADIPETGWVDISSCNYEGSTPLACSPYLRVNADNS